MAIKQRILMNLNTAKNHIFRAMNTGSKEALNEVCQELTKARNLYREGLPQSDYIDYDDICGGLILAVRKMVEDGETSFREEEFSLCQELLQSLENATKKESHFKKEIVFLPYNSSMWDSLESVWKAAYEDKEHCNAYVMPIPYCVRNPDTSAAEWHCEREKFPKYVPTIDWKNVDLEKWHPDVIVYHNPYDDRNNVTSVDSRFYSRNMIKCTDKLVYIPYFVLNEPCRLEDVAHFILTPGVISADLVFVQSEEMRKLYIDLLAEATNIPDKGYWEKRILGIGSPKIDKVLTSKKEDFELPEKWRKLVEGKKVILYNTSVSATLQYSDKVCDKLRCVFDIFRNRDDVVLWWRPHPLMKATFHSMRPQFEEEYLGLEKQYIEEDWGIYDDSSDLHRAICWSDAYYGDASSVVSLYRRTGRPVLLQALQSMRERGELLLAPFSMAIDGDKVYFLPFGMGCLCCLDRGKGGELTVVPIDNGKGERIKWRFGGLILDGEKQIIYPCNGSELVEVNMASGVQRHMRMESLLPEMRTYKFGCWAATWKNKRIILPWEGISAVVYDQKACSWHTLLGLADVKLPKTDGALTLFMGNQDGRHFFVSVFHTNCVIAIDMETEEVQSFFIGGSDTIIHVCHVDGDVLWGLTVNSQLVRCSCKEGRILERWSLPAELRRHDISYSAITVIPKGILLVGFIGQPMNVASSFLLAVNWGKKEYEVKSFPFAKSLFLVDKGQDGKLWFSGTGNEGDFLCEVDVSTWQHVRWRLGITKAQMCLLLRHYWAEGIVSTPVPEGMCSLDDMVEYVQDNLGRQGMNLSIESAGDKIYEFFWGQQSLKR